MGEKGSPKAAGGGLVSRYGDTYLISYAALPRCALQDLLQSCGENTVTSLWAQKGHISLSEPWPL